MLFIPIWINKSKGIKSFFLFFNGGKRGDRVSTIKILMEITSDVLGTI